jgi:hypothetical protein
MIRIGREGYGCATAAATPRHKAKGTRHKAKGKRQKAQGKGRKRKAESRKELTVANLF